MVSQAFEKSIGSLIYTAISMLYIFIEVSSSYFFSAFNYIIHYYVNLYLVHVFILFYFNLNNHKYIKGVSLCLLVIESG